MGEQSPKDLETSTGSGSAAGDHDHFQIVAPFSDLEVRAGLLLRLRRGRDPAPDVAAMARQAPVRRRYLTTDAFARQYGASNEDVAAVRRFAAASSLAVDRIDPAGRLVVLRGTLQQMADAFDCRLDPVVGNDGKTYHRPQQPVEPPDALRPIVEGVFGLDNIPRFARSERIRHAVSPTDQATPAAAETSTKAGSGGMLPSHVASIYDFPTRSTGQGQTLAVLLLGGGFYEDDLRQFFGPRLPRIRTVSIGGANNDPAPKEDIVRFLDELRAGQEPSGSSEAVSKAWWTLEATVDLELAGSFAPDAQIVVYFAPNHELGKIEALTRILNDQNTPQALSCSWGTREEDLDAPFIQAVDRILQLYALRGITVCYASGDSGANMVDGEPSPHFPASSPHVLGCGGTWLQPPSKSQPESVWNESPSPGVILASGGGYSEFFRRPAWQQGVPDAPNGMAQRGVPDVAAKADYENGYTLVLGGQTVTGGGTSSAAPLWAGLICRLDQELRTNVGWINPWLYGPSAAGLTDVLEGSNRLYDAGPGWDACTGKGTPKGQELLEALKKTR